MKLFKSLLVAPATLGLLAPMSATANELNIAEVSAYSSSEEVQNISEFNSKELAVTNSRVDGLEARFNNFEAASFSETTTAAFSATMGIGATNDDDNTVPDNDDAVTAGYSFQIDLNTSFTGEDSLDISIDAGNANTTGIAEFDDNSNGDGLIVDGIAYTFPLGDKTTVKVGDNIDGSDLFTTACVYGGPSTTLSDCGVPNAGIGNGGAMVGVAYDFGTGLTASAGYAGDESTLMTEEGGDDFGLNVAYTGDNYGLSATYGVVETDNGATPAVLDDFTDTYLGLQAYFTPEGGFPSISVGFETGEDESVVGDADSLTSYFIGLTWAEVGPGSAGIAFGTRTPTVEDEEDQHMYEAYYSFPLNDGMTITPLVFIQEMSADGVDDTTGIMVKTTFAF